MLKVIELYAEDNRLPSVKEIREGCGQGRLTNQDKALELLNCAVQGIGQYGLNAKLAKEKLPAMAYLAVLEWGGWYAWASLTDERLDHAKRPLRAIIERMLRTGEVEAMAPSLVDGATMDELIKAEEAKKRNAMYSNPETVEQIKKTADELALKFGFKK